MMLIVRQSLLHFFPDVRAIGLTEEFLDRPVHFFSIVRTEIDAGRLHNIIQVSEVT